MQSRTIYYAIRETDNTGIYFEEVEAVCNTVYEPNAPTAQRPKPAIGKEAIEKNLQEMRPDGVFTRVLLRESEFWSKLHNIRPALTIDINPDDYNPSWDNE